MLGCYVVQGARHATITADIAEAAAALDAAGAGALFDTLVDDPASADEIVDAYFGSIMVEAANADDSWTIPQIYAADIVEAATAADAADATKLVTVSTIWNSSDATNILLSNGNLTAAASANAQASVRATVSKAASGKYYFEITGIGTSQNSAIGISTASPGGSTLVPTQSIFCNWANGLYFLSGAGTGGGLLAPLVSGDIVGVAIDLTNKRAWFRKNSTIWNNDGAANPATNTNGVDISSVFASAAAFPIVTFNGTGLTHTANFGPSFTFAAPSGFTVWG